MITYPVNVATARFTVVAGGVTTRNRRWPKADGSAFTPSPGEVIMQEVIAAPPAFNPATQRLGTGAWVDDPVNETATFQFPVVALTQPELDQLTENTDRSAKRALIAQAIPVLRQWSDDAAVVTVTAGNAVATLQVIVNRLSIFFDRFADLLEVQRIDK